MSEVMPAARPWRTATLAGMASYLDGAGLMAMGLVIGTLYGPAFDLGEGVIGGILGLQTLMFGLGALFGGRLGDRYGRRRVLTWALVGYAAGTTVLMLATGPAHLFAGAVIAGVSIGADLPVSLAIADEEAPPGRKGRMVAFSQVLWAAGSILVIVTAVLVEDLGALGGRIIFAELLVVCVVVIALRTTLRESAEWSAARQAADAPRDAAPVRFSRLGQLFRPPVGVAVLATGLFFSTWNVGANTVGQFGPYLWVEFTGTDVGSLSLVLILTLVVGAGTTLIFLRVVDTPARRRWYWVGAIATLLAFGTPAVLGPTWFSLAALVLLFGVGTTLAGEALYKVWAQELIPTLLRSTAQGAGLFAARTFAALIGFVTPALAVRHTTFFFWLVFSLTAVSMAIGAWWIPRLPRARDLDPPPPADRQPLDAPGGFRRRGRAASAGGRRA